MEFTFDLQLFAKSDSNPDTIHHEQVDYKKPEYNTYQYSIPTKLTTGDVEGNLEDLTFWFSKNISDIDTITSLYDSVSANKTHFDQENPVCSVNIAGLFAKINFTNMEEINTILPKIYLNVDISSAQGGTYAYTPIILNNIYHGINMFKTQEGKFKTQYPNTFTLKPKFNSTISFNQKHKIDESFVESDHDTYSDEFIEKSIGLFGYAFVKTLDVSDVVIFKYPPAGQIISDQDGYNRQITGMFKGCLAQEIVGLDKMMQNMKDELSKTKEGKIIYNYSSKIYSIGNELFKNAFNMDKYIDKIENEDTKKELRKAYYNSVLYGDSDDEETREKCLFSYWRKDRPLVLDCIGGQPFDLKGAFEGAYIKSVDISGVTNRILPEGHNVQNLFKDASVETIDIGNLNNAALLKEKEISKLYPGYNTFIHVLYANNMLNVSKTGPFKLRQVKGSITFPKKNQLENLVTKPIVLLEQRSYFEDFFENMLPSEDAIEESARRNFKITLVNYDLDMILELAQSNKFGNSKTQNIRTEEDVIRFFGGLPKKYWNLVDDVPPKPADFDTNKLSPEAIRYITYNKIKVEKPADFDTNPYTEASILYRKINNLSLPMPEGFTERLHNSDKNHSVLTPNDEVYRKFYNIELSDPL